jgi:hypothetical protein
MTPLADRKKRGFHRIFIPPPPYYINPQVARFLPFCTFIYGKFLYGKLNYNAISVLINIPHTPAAIRGKEIISENQTKIFLISHIKTICRG